MNHWRLDTFSYCRFTDTFLKSVTVKQAHKNTRKHLCEEADGEHKGDYKAMRAKQTETGAQE